MHSLSNKVFSFFCFTYNTKLFFHHQLFLPARSSTLGTSVEKQGDRICELRGETAADGWNRRRGAGEINPRYMSLSVTRAANYTNIIN